MDPKKRKMLIWYLSVCLLVSIVAFVYWFILWRHREYTNDAYVEGNQVYITPLHSGFLTAIHTDDTFLVKQGQLLIELDETDAKIGLDRAKEHLANIVREVCQMIHAVFAYRSEIEMKKAEFIKTAQDYEHRENVIAEGGVSLEDFEHAIAGLRSSFFSLQMTEILYDKALAAVQNVSITGHPSVLAAADAVRDAWVKLYRCKIYSPVEGLAAQRTIQVGMWVESGTPLLSVIPLDQIWVNANYKETQMKRMRLGQQVKLTVDLYGDDVLFHGRIIGLPGGAGNAFSLLPPQNLSGNWIKIVQRLPVRVALDPDQLKQHPLRIGLSTEATTDTRDNQGLIVPISTYGSPLYETPIFKKEEIGDQAFIKQIIEINMDPLLEDYLYTPFTPQTIQVHDIPDF
ncbi:MAG: efflux RND transporter periplasmic adaptor subunit [Chlamydiae bacterium]|jgi:membrane fusion protein, multidrug efflux system|nr:efflux RND transporter periplasmic adaptor subunit [Chlamydiota bacterium]